MTQIEKLRSIYANPELVFTLSSEEIDALLADMGIELTPFINKELRLISQVLQSLDQEAEDICHLVSDLRVLRQEDVNSVTPKIVLESKLDSSFHYELMVDYQEGEVELKQWCNGKKDDKPLYFTESNKEDYIEFSQGKASLDDEKQIVSFCQQIKGLERYQKIITPFELANKLNLSIFSQKSQNPQDKPTLAQLALLTIEQYLEELGEAFQDFQLAVSYRRGANAKATSEGFSLPKLLLAVTDYNEEYIRIKGLNSNFTFALDKLTVLENGERNENVELITTTEFEVIFQHSPKESHVVQMTWEVNQGRIIINLFINN